MRLMRIAMWSGPRNLSTAMMYAFGNRDDFAVWDEPFYAPYLAASGMQHPMHAEIMAAHDADPNSVAKRCVGSIPHQKPRFYMKHMPHHILDGFPIGWASDCTNIHLIRHPARVIASYGAKRECVTFDDIGFAQQTALYEKLGGIVIDSADIRADPKGMLTALCEVIGLPFDPAMLSWKAGPHSDDGIWASHWYGAVHQSTGFAGAEGAIPQLTGVHADLLEKALPHYEKMHAARLSLT